MDKIDIWKLLSQDPNQAAANSPLMASYMPEQSGMPKPQEMRMKSISIPVSTKNGPGVGESYQKQLEDQFGASMANRNRDLETMQNKLSEFDQQKPQGLAAINLKPMLAFADNLNNTKSAGNYAAPDVTEKWQAQKSRLEDMINKEKNGLSDDQLNFLKMRAQEESANARLGMSLRAQERAAARGESSDEDKLRRQYMGADLYKSMAKINEAYAGVDGNPGITGPDQQALVFQFSKILDPGSVVRESEYAQSAANMGKINQARQLWSKLSSGEALTPIQVSLMKEVARNLVESSRTLLDSHNKTFSELAVRKGIHPDNVVIDPFYGNKKSAGAKLQGSKSAAPDFDKMTDEELAKY